jgi:hypothetical protein
MEYRNRWERFTPESRDLISSGINHWYYYECNNGHLAYCTELNKIIFKDLRGTGDTRSITIPFEIGNFTFDLAQDVVIVTDDSQRFVSFFLVIL